MILVFKLYLIYLQLNQNAYPIMKTKFYALLLAVSVLSIASCKKDSDATGDLTSEIVGHYTNASDNTEIFVNKIDDNSVSVTMSTGSGSGSYDIAWPKAKMNSKTSFTTDSVEHMISSCTGTKYATATATASNNNISLFIHWDGTPGVSNGYWSQCSDDDRSISASK